MNAPKGRPTAKTGDPSFGAPTNQRREAPMGTSSQTPKAPRVVTLHKRPLPRTEFVDRVGDVWTASGHNGRGELLLSCPEPHEVRDAGEGESYPWTLHDVQREFGPLIARTAVTAA